MKAVVVLCGLVLAALAIGPARAKPLLPLQRAVDAAEKLADQRVGAFDKLHRDTLAALNRGKSDAFTAAEEREKAGIIGELQSAAALRRARQELAEAVNAAVDQGEAIEHAAARAARGEVVPSINDLLACDGPDCVAVSPGEHAALALMGAVTPSFDAANWPPAGEDPPVTVLGYRGLVPLTVLRARVDDAAARSHDAAVAAERARAALAADPTLARVYAEALTASDAARADQNAASAHLARVVNTYADSGRALKRAAILAGDGYILQRGGRKACHRDACVTSEGLEAAAFLALGAAEEMNDGLKNLAAFVIQTADGGFVFR